jgi:hypothetical protein
MAYITISNEPIKEIRFVRTLVKNLSLMYDPSTRKPRNIAERMNGKGTGEPGAGTQAERVSLMI